jgi:adenylate cyclase
VPNAFLLILAILTAQLIDATNGAHLWADRYDRDLTDIFAVQDDVTRRIVDALRVTLSPTEKARLANSWTSNIDAHDCYLRGRELLALNPRTVKGSNSRQSSS